MTAGLFENNLRWAAGHVQADPGYFRRQASGGPPRYLWIACSDCPASASEIVGLDAGELLVHRNLANLAPPQDAGFLSVLQFALEVRKVRHVVVCGHYGCAAVHAALDGARLGLVDHWLQPVREACRRDASSLEGISDFSVRANQASERNVRAQVASLADNPLVRDAWRRRQRLAIHGWIYAAQDGLLRDLETTINGLPAADALLRCGPAPAAGAPGPRGAGRRP